ncbi:Hpt domain-containing protein [Desulfogranum mediterraneum]|uniref:Hpt domain-containing protein n=1 Tax=Desulfogranum mediterraneum TaxID=160661 RepID=UPI00041626CA|nr:Hpt domain-containing protein [Desulfogranum mediterraneum]
MPLRVSNDYLSSYLEEVQSYVPALQSALATLEQEGQVAEVVTEVHRQMHIIRGASAMVGVAELSELAGQAEELVEAVIEARCGLDDPFLTVMSESVAAIDLYCQAMEKGTEADPEAIIAVPLAGCRALLADIPAAKSNQGMVELIPADLDEEEQLAVEELNTDSTGLIEDFFRQEAEEHLQGLHLEMVRLGQQVSTVTPVSAEIRQNIATVRRIIHTLKGAAAMVALETTAGFAHQLEDYLDDLFGSANTLRPGQVTLLVSAIDLLAALVESPQEVDKQKLQALVEQLQLPGGEGGGLEEQSLSFAPAIECSSMAALSREEVLELFAGFRDEAQEHLEIIQAALAILLGRSDEQGKRAWSGRPDEVAKIRRSVHTVKGAAGVVGLQDIAGLAHGLEDYLDGLFDSGQELTAEQEATLVEALDLLALLIDRPDEVDQTRCRQVGDGLRRYPEQQVVTEGALFQGLRPDDGGQGEENPGAEDRQALLVSPSLPRVEGRTEYTLGEASQTLRVNRDQLDSMVNLANELLVGISGFEQRLVFFRDAVNELELSRERLKKIASELEINFEVKALDDFGAGVKRLQSTMTQLGEGDGYGEFDAMELDRYTQLNLVIRSLNEAVIDIGAIRGNLGLAYSDIDADINRQRRHVRELQLQLMRTRMNPLASITPRLGRTMRDVAAKLDKQVELKVTGEEIELDRVVWEKLADPFMHLIRNAIHHGIEDQETRLAAGKPRIATLTISVKRTGNQVIIRCGDDGQGLDYDAIRTKAALLGMGEQVETMSRRQLTELIFYPGFSTKSVSEISGRGVGMDVVRENIQQLQGSITVETIPGQGTSFVITLPLTMGVVKSLLVESGKVNYAIPISDIKEIRRVDRADIDRAGHHLRFEEATIPWFSLATLLGREVSRDVEPEERPMVLLLDLLGEEVALEISAVIGQSELVVKGLGSYLQAVKGVAGASLLGDGTLVPVLNIYELTLARTGRQIEPLFPLEMEEKPPLKIMVVDDSISVRRVVSRFVLSMGWEALEAKDGLDALELLETNHPDFILLDVEMPRLNGFEFLAKLQHISEKRDIPVAMLTSRTSRKHREKAFSLGARGFLNKPYKDEELVHLVRDLTGYQEDEGMVMAEGDAS